MDYESYRKLRLLDRPAIQVYAEFKDRETKRADMSFTNLLCDMICGAITYVIVCGVLRRVFIFQDTPLWIKSPSGKTIVALPLPIALRVIRKHEWDFAEVEPIKPPRIISRREALNILLFGDKCKER